MSDTIIGALIGGCFGLIGVGLGLWWNRNATQKAVDLSFGKATELLKKQRFLDAGAEFRNAFVETIYTLNAPRKQNITDDHLAYDIIKNRAVKHDQAMIRFRHHIPYNKIAAFDREWKKYRCEHDTPNIKDDPFICYMERPGQKEDSELRKDAIDRIKKLFESTEV